MKQISDLDWKMNMGFRALRYDDNVMVDVQGVFFEEDKTFLKVNGKRVPRCEYLLLPYIGLKDKYNKKVFEGDILKVKQTIYSDCSKSKIEAIKEYMAVVHIEKCAVLLMSRNRKTRAIAGKLLFYDIDNLEIEVLGNIFKNIDILKND